MKKRFPILVTHKGVIAKIHRSFQIQKGKRYDDFMVVYSENGKRKRLRRSTIEAAQIAAKNACHRINTGQHLTYELANGERQTYSRAVEPCAAIGVKLDVVAQEYANALRRLPPGTTLKDAVDCLCMAKAGIRETRTVKQAVKDMIEVKRMARLSDSHIKDLESRLGAFAEAFDMNIGDVSSAMLQVWIDRMNVSGRTKQNYMRSVAALLNFAVRRKWAPKEIASEIDAVQLPKAENEEIEIFSPEEMQEILAVARPEMIPWIVIGGFAGLRSAETARVDWGEVNLQERFIEITAKKAKTAARRLAPVTDNLAQWLAPHKKESGPVLNFESWWNQIPKIVEAVNASRKKAGKEKRFIWRHNALRHSFCSYRLATIKNVAQVALEAGNSPQMIFQHYRQVVTETEAAKWFSIVPPVKSKACHLTK